MGKLKCTAPGCTAERLARELCATHYGVLYRAGGLPPRPPKPGEHGLSQVDREARTAVYAICGPVRMIRIRKGPRGAECSVKRKQDKRGYRLSPAKRAEMMHRQQNRCAICLRTELEVGQPFVVDHCHSTLRVRGLLCTPCNVALGFLRDDTDRVWRAFAYLNNA